MMKCFKLFSLIIFIFQFNLFATNYYVKAPGDGGNDANDGLSWANAKATIQSAIDASGLFDYVFVKYGTYVIDNTIVWSTTRRLTSDDGSHTSWDTAQPDSSLCILQGNNCRVLITTGFLNAQSKFRGFKITGGNATNETSYKGKGGGMLLKDGGLIVERCWITGNTANSSSENPGYGGGIFYEGGTGVYATVINCKFENNIASINSIGYGGALYLPDSYNNITFTNNIVNNNTASMNKDGRGGGIEIYTGSLILNNTFYDNYASQSNESSSSGCQGGAIWNNGSSTICNNTFYKNVNGPKDSWGGGCGIYHFTGSPSIENNIFLNHNVSGSDQTAIFSYANISIGYNCFMNNTTNYNSSYVTSTNEITDDPLLSDPSNGDFTLQSGSPCIDTGDPSFSVPEGGEPQIDIGAYEFITAGQQVLNNIDNNIESNLLSGLGISIASESGLINANIQQTLSDPLNLPDGSKHIGKYWTISGLTGNAKIRLYYCEEAGASFTGNPTIYHYSGGAWQALPTSAAVAVGCCRYVETTNVYSSFSDVTIGDSDNPLPVELTSFTATFNKNVKLNWQTKTEVNNYGFEVQRSSVSANALPDKEVNSQNSNGNIIPGGVEGWKKIGFVEGKGNSNSVKKYSFVDEAIPAGKYYYRLQQIDNDGTAKYSDKVEVEIAKPTSFNLEQNYPNPFNPSTKINYSLPEDSHVILKVYDVIGREVKTLVNENKQAGTYTVNFEGGGFSDGVYIYKISAGKFSKVRKMILLK